MKTVDSNYSYDELEGFQPVMGHSTGDKDKIWLCAYTKTVVSMSMSAKNYFEGRDYIQLYYNSQTKQLLIAACTPDTPGCIKRSKTPRWNIHSINLIRLLEQECRYDLSVVNIRIPGIPSRSRKNAIIFDLKSAKAEKKWKKGKRA